MQCKEKTAHHSSRATASVEVLGCRFCSSQPVHCQTCSFCSQTLTSSKLSQLVGAEPPYLRVHSHRPTASFQHPHLHCCACSSGSQHQQDTMTEGQPNPTQSDARKELDTKFAELQAGAPAWASMPLMEKVAVLKVRQTLGQQRHNSVRCAVILRVQAEASGPSPPQLARRARPLPMAPRSFNAARSLVLSTPRAGDSGSPAERHVLVGQGRSSGQGPGQ